jgi:hypothetical protein
MNLSRIGDAALTDSLLRGDSRGIRIQSFKGRDGWRISVWLPTTQDFDPPDGTGETVSEALEYAAHRVRN